MFDLHEELYRLIRALGDARVDYALCGGLALAVHGKVRATIDIDLLVEHGTLAAVKDACRSRGFIIEADPMRLAGGDVVIERLSAVIEDEVVSVDLLVVTDATRGAWDTRVAVQWRGVELWVVSREGLIALKQLRRSGQDLDDIVWLETRNAG